MAKRVLTFGTFDRLHPGHLYILREAEKRGDLTVVVARDVTVERIKGKAAQQSEEKRRSAIQETFPEATVILGDTEDYLAPMQQVHPDVIVLGYDQELPPGVEEDDLPCPIERLEAYEPGKYKSSLLNG